MKKDPGLIFRFFLMLGDALAIIFSFAFAYYFRTHIDQRPYYFDAEISKFVGTVALLVPIWIIILAALGLYRKTIFQGSRLKETLRLLAASAIGVMVIITYDFFEQNDLFPVRIVAIYAMIFCFILLFSVRTIIRIIRKALFRSGHGILRTIVIGNNQNTEALASHMLAYPEDGYRLVGIVAKNQFIPRDMRTKYKFSSLEEAITKTKPDAIFQTDEQDAEDIYQQTIEYHLAYYFVPSESVFSSHIGQVELVGNTPAILASVTPLIGAARFAKRTMDIIIGGIITIIALIPMGIIWLISKISDPKASPVYVDHRLSRFNKKVKFYKFRSMKSEYSGMTPEEAFTKMGKPELIKKYRKNGDYLPNDPRVTKLGKFLRATSLDELPQLFNVLKGDISLVGPRALQPDELKDYGDRSLLLSVKSGLTGLAQVSGRRGISFEERRALDLYYIQNWTFGLDIQIIFRTIGTVLGRKGAK